MSRLLRAALAASTAVLPFTGAAFAQTAATLLPVVVQGDGDKVPIEDTTAGEVQGYRALTATSATKTSTPIEQIPQSIQVVPRELIDDQLAVSVSEAARNVSNVQPPDALMVGNTDQTPLKIRGFPAEQWRDGLVNLYDAGDRDGIVNVERLEILKGPNAILYGGGTGAPLGGTINVISKLPTDKARAEVGFRLGSYSYWAPFFDANQPLNADKTILFRLTGEYTDNRSYIDVVRSKRYNINPTLTFTNRSDTSLTIQGYISRQQQQAYQGLPVDGTLLGDFRARRSLFIGPSSIQPSYSKTQGIVATFDHQFNQVWSANLKARWSQSQFDQMAQNIFGSDATGALPAFPPSTWMLQNLEVRQKQQEYTINPNLQAKFATGPSRNTFMVGLDYSRVKDKGFMTADYLGNMCYLMTLDPLTCPPATVDLNNPSFPIAYTKPGPSAGMEYVPFYDFNNDYVTKGAYAQIQSSLYGRVHLLGGARLANIDIDYTENASIPSATYTTTRTKLLPRAGAVVELTRGLSAYASYSQGMRWAGFTTAVSRPEPETSTSLEAGLKANFNDALSGTVSVFDIRRKNVPVTIALGRSGLTEQQSRGFEADLVWQPDRNWSFLGSYGFTDAKFSDSFRGYSGQTVPAGNALPFVSRHSGRIWANYKFSPDVLPGWSIGAGAYAASGQYVDNENLWKTGGYYTVDAKIGYEHGGFRAAITAKNLTGEEYYTPYSWLGGQVAPGAPRMIYGQISYAFN